MKGTVARFYVNLFAAVVVASWLAVLSVGCSDDVVASTASASTQPAPTTLESAVGTFAGEYRFTDPARGDAYGITLTIDADGSVTADAETREGSTVELTGTLQADGTLTAHGRPPQADGEATLTGTLIVRDGVVSIEGSWQSASRETGTWTVTKKDL